MLGPWYVGDTPATDIIVHVERDGVTVAMSSYDSGEVLLYDPDGAQATWNGTVELDAADDVVILHPPTTSPFAEKGIHTLYIRLITEAETSETFFADLIQVMSTDSNATWATVGQVYSITGVLATDAQILDAQEVVELHCGRTYDATENMKPKDVAWLRKAVAFQAIWQPNQPGYHERHTVKESIQDGAQVVFASGSEPANTGLFMLAPLAMRAIKNLSWMGSTTIRLRAPRYGARALTYEQMKSNDDHGGWMPI